LYLELMVTTTVIASKQASKQERKIYTQRLKTTVTKRWCLEQLNTFSVSGIEDVQGQIKPTDMCEKTISKAWSDSSECSISKT